MRVLLAPMGGTGHLMPVLAFARVFRSAGAEVAFALPGFAEPPVREAGFPTLALSSSEPFEAAARRRSIDLASLNHPERDAFMFETIVLGAHLEDRLTTLMDFAREWAADVIVWGDGNFVAAVAGDRLGLPHAGVQVFAVGRMLSAFPDMRESLVARINALRAVVGLAPDPNLEAPYRHLLLSQFPFGLLAPEEVSLTTRVALRPTPSGTGNGSPMPDWVSELVLHHHEPRVYATLGTLMPRDEGLPILRAVLDGLADEQLRVIVTTGPTLDPSDLDPMPPNARCARYIPQELLLPNCDMVVFHGGSGTLIGAVDHGVPMLIVPIRADQPHNALAVHVAGAGRVLPPGEVTPEAVRSSVSQLLDQASYRSNARRLQAQLHALPPMDEAVRLIAGLQST